MFHNYVLIVFFSFSVFASLTIPHFDIIISLIASVCLCILGISLPGVMDMCLRYPNNYGPGRIAQVRDIFLIFFGILACISGIVNAGLSIYYRYTGAAQI